MRYGRHKRSVNCEFDYIHIPPPLLPLSPPSSSRLTFPRQIFAASFHVDSCYSLSYYALAAKAKAKARRLLLGDLPSATEEESKKENPYSFSFFFSMMLSGGCWGLALAREGERREEERTLASSCWRRRSLVLAAADAFSLFETFSPRKGDPLLPPILTLFISLVCHSRSLSRVGFLYE